MESSKSNEKKPEIKGLKCHSCDEHITVGTEEDFEYCLQCEEVAFGFCDKRYVKGSETSSSSSDDILVLRAKNLPLFVIPEEEKENDKS